MWLTDVAFRAGSDTYMLLRMCGASEEKCAAAAKCAAEETMAREEILGRGICEDCFGGYVQVNGRFERCARCHGTARAKPRRLEVQP